MNKLKLLSAISLMLVVDIAVAVTCGVESHPTGSEVNTLKGPALVSSVKIGDVLINGEDFLEVLRVTHNNGDHQLTTILLPNGPVGPSGVSVDQCD